MLEKNSSKIRSEYTWKKSIKNKDRIYLKKNPSKIRGEYVWKKSIKNKEWICLKKIHQKQGASMVEKNYQK